MRPNFLILLLLLQVLFAASSHAWFWSKSNTVDMKDLYVQNHSVIEKKFKDQSQNIYDIKLEIFIPHPENGDIVVSTFVDESLKKPIKDIAWIIAGKKQDLRISKNSVNEVINKYYEQIASENNPTQAYDRISQGKNIVNKVFNFSKNDIIPRNLSPKSVKENYLELDFGDNDKKRIAVNKYIYQTMTYNIVDLPVERSKPPKKKEEKKNNKVFIPKKTPPVNPTNPNAPLILSPEEIKEGQVNPYITPPLSQEAEELFNLKNDLDEFSRQIYPQNYSETDTQTDYDTMQQMLDDDYYGADEEEGNEYEELEY